MKKPAVKLIISLVLTAILSVALLFNLQTLSIKPTNNTISFNNASIAKVGPDKNTYIINNSRKSVIKLNEKNEYKYSISYNEKTLYQLSDIAIDSKGYVYVLNTILDSYGLYVKEEKIDRYKPNGSFDKNIFKIKYSKNDKTHLRIGQIRSLQIRDNQLYFFTYNNNYVEQNTIKKNKREILQHIKLPENTYLSEITGTQLGSIVYATKRGEIYLINEKGESKGIFTKDHKDWTGKYVPESVKMVGNKILFTNLYESEVKYIDLDSPSYVNSFFTAKDLKNLGFEITPNFKNISIGSESSIILLVDNNVLITDANGIYNNIIKEASYSKKEIGYHWLIWSLVGIWALLLLYSIKVFYFNVIKRKVSLIIKQLIVFVPLIIVAMLFMSNIVTKQFSARYEQEVLRELALITHTGGGFIDGDKLQNIKSTKDFMGNDYLNVYDGMRRLFKGNDEFEREGLYATLYKFEDRNLYKIYDDDDSSNILTPFPTGEENLQVLDFGKIVTGKWDDETGYFIYSIGPVYNSQNEVVGILEVGKDMNGFVKQSDELFKQIIATIIGIALIIVIMFTIMTLYFLSPVWSLRKSVNEIASGNYDVEVFVRSKDEISDLGDRFNIMTQHIRKYIEEITEFNEAYYRFVPQQFMNFLGKTSILHVKLGDQVEKKMCILVSNIRSFHQLSKNMTPEENFNYINSFLNMIGPSIRKHDGIINKYVGSGVVSLFSKRPENAVKSALDLRRKLNEFNRNEAGHRQIDIGIGIHYGSLMLGIIGEEKRLESAIISDNVNVAEGIEDISEILGASILITAELLNEIKKPDMFEYRKLGKVLVAGKDESVTLYDIFEGDEEELQRLKRKTKELFENGVFLYQEGRFTEARTVFVEVIRQNPLDKAAKLYFYLCDEFHQNGTPNNWNANLYWNS